MARSSGAVAPLPGERVLDLAAGTGTSSQPFADAGAEVVPCDFSIGMLRVGKEHRPHLPFTAGDGTRLPFADDTFDAVTISFGLRNIVDPGAGLREMLRVTRPGGRLVVCEFSHPDVGALPHRVRRVPDEGAAADRPRRCRSSPDAYVYLAESIRAWPDQAALAALVAEAGWQRPEWRNLSGGIVDAAPRHGMTLTRFAVLTSTALLVATTSACDVGGLEHHASTPRCTPPTLTVVGHRGQDRPLTVRPGQTLRLHGRAYTDACVAGSTTIPRAIPHLQLVLRVEVPHRAARHGPPPRGPCELHGVGHDPTRDLSRPGRDLRRARASSRRGPPRRTALGRGRLRACAPWLEMPAPWVVAYPPDPGVQDLWWSPRLTAPVREAVHKVTKFVTQITAGPSSEQGRERLDGALHAGPRTGGPRRGLRHLLGDHVVRHRTQALQPRQARLLRVRHRADPAAGRRRPVPGEVLHHRDDVHRLRHRDRLPLPVGGRLRRSCGCSGWSRWCCSSSPCSSPTPTSGVAAAWSGTERMGLHGSRREAPERRPADHRRGRRRLHAQGVASGRPPSAWPAAPSR